MEEMSNLLGSISFCIKKSQFPDKVVRLFVCPLCELTEGGHLTTFSHVLVDVREVAELDGARDAVHRRTEVKSVEPRVQDTAKLRSYSLESVTLRDRIYPYP